MKKLIMAWSGGKDSTLALHMLLASGRCEVACLLTTVNEHYRRISMHGVRQELLELQAEALGIPLEIVYVPEQTTNTIYEERMGEKLSELQQRGLKTVAFGDIFLEDLREYRKEQLRKLGMEAVFPIWKRNTRTLVHQFIELGYKAYTVCVDDRLGEIFAGRLLDEDFVAELPAEVDPCGENGEFHSFVFDGPIFNKPVKMRTGERVTKSYKEPYPNQFVFCDLLPKD